MSVTPDLVTAATSEMDRALSGFVTADWSQLAGDLDWSCRQTGAHVADDLFSYASQILAQPQSSYLPIEVTVDDEATPQELLRCVVMCGELLRLAADSAPGESRAWHPYGTSDPLGFAAMGVVEVLVHTYDIARGLGIDWVPPDALCEAILLRLFPAAPRGEPSDVLLWSAGRAPLGERPRLNGCRWDSSVRG